MFVIGSFVVQIGVSLIQILTSAPRYCPPSEYTKSNNELDTAQSSFTCLNLGIIGVKAVQDEGTYFIASTACTNLLIDSIIDGLFSSDRV